MSDANDERLVRAVRARLDASAQELDPAIRARLADARRRAVAARALRPRRWPVSAGALAAAVGALAVSLWLARPATAPETPQAMLQDLDVLTAAEDLEFYQRLEFYRWLEARHDAQG